MKKIIVAGSRHFDDYERLCLVLDDHIGGNHNVQIICGMARGADRLGRQYAIDRGLECILMPADWNRYGRSAGAIRNKHMAQIADECVVFWDRKSSGTRNMIEQADDYGVPVRIVTIV